VGFRVLIAILVAAIAAPAAGEHVFCTQWRDGDASERLRLALKFARQTPPEVRTCVMEGLVTGSVDKWVEDSCPKDSDFTLGLVLGGIIWAEAHSCSTTGTPPPWDEAEPFASEKGPQIVAE
jgi:hypothetical protein